MKFRTEKIYLILVILVALSCNSRQGTNEKILSDIFPQLIDSLWINETNIMHPPPPPLYDQDSNLIGVDTTSYNAMQKEYKQRLRKIDSIDSRLLIGVIDTCRCFQIDDFENRTYSNDTLIKRVMENNPDLNYTDCVIKVDMIKTPSEYELILISKLKKQYADFWNINNRKFGGLIAFSTTIFDSENKYGLIKVEKYPFYLQGSGHFLLIENNNGNWRLIKVYRDWVS